MLLRKQIVLITVLVVLLFPTQTVTGQARSEWVYESDGKLHYKKTANGDKIMDFSHAGYRSGGIALPQVAVKVVVKPDGSADYTSKIQQAIDEVSKLAPNKEGHRGAVMLAEGVYPCSEEIVISVDGVVLRGTVEGSQQKSVILMTGGKHAAIRAVGANERTEKPTYGYSTHIMDSYVASGATEFSVQDASGFTVGDVVELQRPVTKKWVEFMEMDDMVRNDKPQIWMSEGSTIPMRREILSIEGNKITVKVPLSDSFDANYLNPPGTRVVKLNRVLLKEVGLEDLSIVAPEQNFNHSQQLYSAIRLIGEDCWIRNINIEETMNSVSLGGERITVQNVDVIRKALHTGASKPAEFAPNGTQILLDRCSVEGDNIWFVALGGRHSGPIVLLNCNFKGNGRIEGHQRWSTGLLLDNCNAPQGGIDFKNRGSMGSGHGWGLGWAVAWNCVAKDYVIQQPPGVHNWAIGSIGEIRRLARPFNSEPLLPVGTIDSHGEKVAPKSLYLSQLKERLGVSALKAIGY